MSLRPPARRLRTVEVTSRGKDRREPARRVRVAGAVRESVGARRAGKLTAFLQECPEIEGAVLVAAPLSPAIARLGGTQLPPRLMQNPEIQCRARVRERVSLAIGELGADRIAPLFEQHAQSKPLRSSKGAVRRCVYAPRHLPAFPTTVLATHSFDQLVGLDSLDLFVAEL